jgi:hypothetical protein
MYRISSALNSLLTRPSSSSSLITIRGYRHHHHLVTNEGRRLIIIKKYHSTTPATSAAALAKVNPTTTTRTPTVSFNNNSISSGDSSQRMDNIRSNSDGIRNDKDDDGRNTNKEPGPGGGGGGGPSGGDKGPHINKKLDNLDVLSVAMAGLTLGLLGIYQVDNAGLVDDGGRGPPHENSYAGMYDDAVSSRI